MHLQNGKLQSFLGIVNLWFGIRLNCFCALSCATLWWPCGLRTTFVRKLFILHFQLPVKQLINALAKFEAESSANIKKEMKKVKFIFIELNSLQIGFITHHQLKRGWASKKVCVRWINAFGVDYKVRQMNEKNAARWLATTTE